MNSFILAVVAIGLTITVIMLVREIRLRRAFQYILRQLLKRKR